jgi:hypothetical protein
MKRFGLMAGTAIALMTLATPALAQEKAGDEHAVGFYISNIAGSGMSYQRIFANGWGFRVSGIGWGQGRSMFVNAGAAVTKDIDRRDWGRLYGLLAVGTGVGNFAGDTGAGLNGGTNVQANLAPGIGVQWGPLNAEIGSGLMWRF